MRGFNRDYVTASRRMVSMILSGTGVETVASQSEQMISLSMGLLFTLLGSLKAYGLCKGYEGGPGKGF